MGKKRETDILATESSGNVFAGLGLSDMLAISAIRLASWRASIAPGSIRGRADQGAFATHIQRVIKAPAFDPRLPRLR
jgi:hypothetical protein